ncbi:hypothetical protein BGZ94_008295 [Podila epigama]|nr:hypothetical protein BGZ94_008295 [Podila epigama]
MQQVGPVSLQSIIQVISDHKRYHPSVVDELAVALDAATVQPDLFPQHAKQVKLLVNQSLSTLARWSNVIHSPDRAHNDARPPTSTASGIPVEQSMDQPTYSHIAQLVDMSFLGIEALEDLSQDRATSLFEIEKARSNLISKVIELGMKKRALHELGRMKKRLLQAAAGLWTNRNDNVVVERSGATSPRPGIPGGDALGQGTTKSSAETLKLIYQHLFSITIPHFPLPEQSCVDAHVNTMILLVVSLQTNAIRCWTDVRNGTLTYLLNEMLRQSGSPLEWTLRLRAMNRQGSQRPSDAFFRLLFIAAEKISECDKSQHGHVQTFQLRLLALRFYAIYQSGLEDKTGIIWDKILRCANVFETQTRDANQDLDTLTILQSYRDIYDFIKEHTFIDESLQTYHAWCKHFTLLAQKVATDEYRTFVRNLSVKDQDRDMTNVRPTTPSTLLSPQTHQPPRSELRRAQSDQGPNREEKTTVPQRLADLNRVSSSPQMGTHGAMTDLSDKQVVNYLADAVAEMKRFEGQLILWQSGKGIDSDVERHLTGAKLKLGKLWKSVALFPHTGVVPATLKDIARIFGSLDTLRSFGLKLVTQYEKDEPAITQNSSTSRTSQSPEDQGTVARRMTLLAATKELIQILVDLSLELLLYTLSKSNAASPLPPIMSYLESAFETAREMADRESLIWISNALYNHGGNLYRSGKQEQAIRPLQLAIVANQLWLDAGTAQAVKSKTAKPANSLRTERKLDDEGGYHEERMTLASRYEVLGACQAAIGDASAALHSIESGLVALPVTEFLLIDTTAIKDVRSCNLPAAKLLIRRVRFILKREGEPFISAVNIPALAEKLDQQGAPIIVQGIIQEYECSLLSVLSVKTNQFKSRHKDQALIMTHLMTKVYRGGRSLMNPIRRARVLLNVATIHPSSDNQRHQSETVFLVQEAIELLKECDFKGDQDLGGYRNHYLAMAYTWYGILDRTSEGNVLTRRLKSFQIALQLWEAILSNVDCFVSWEDVSLLNHQSKVNQARQHIPDPKHLFGHLQMLADCMGVIDDRVTQVQIYRLMLRLCNGVMSVDEATCADAVRIYVNMSQAYLALGYSGKAKMALSHGKAILDEMTTSGGSILSDDQIFSAWLLAQSLYLTTVGSRAEGIEAYNQARALSTRQPLVNTIAARGNSDLSVDHTLLKKAEAKAYKSLVVAEAALARSQLLYHEGNLSEAIADAVKAVKQLGRYVYTVSKAIQESQKDDTVIRKQEMENPFLVPTAPAKQEQESRHAKDSSLMRQGLETLVSQRYQWSAIRLLIEAFHQLSKLHLALGCVRETEYFLGEGKDVAELSKAAKSMDRFLLERAELSLRKHEWEKSQQILQGLDMQDDSSYGESLAWEIQDARIQLMYGDLYYAAGHYDRSMQAYYRTEQVLSHLMDKSVISGLEQLVIREPQTPRETRLITIYKQHNTGARDISGLPSGTTAMSLRRILQGMSEQALFECVALNRIKAVGGYRTGLILSRKGQRSRAIAMIEESKAQDTVSYTAAEYHLVMAKTLMMELDDLLSKHLMYAMLPDSVLSAGLFVKLRVSRMPPAPALFAKQEDMDDPYAARFRNAPRLLSSPTMRATRSNLGLASGICSPLRKTGEETELPSGGRLPGSTSTARYMEVITQAQEQLQKAYALSVDTSPSHIVTDICLRLAYLYMLESSFEQEHVDNVNERRLNALRASCHLEMSKAITARREMYGLVKQKLNPVLPHEELDWPRGILTKGQPQGAVADSDTHDYNKSNAQHDVSDQNRGRILPTGHVLELEKPRRLDFNAYEEAGPPGTPIRNGSRDVLSLALSDSETNVTNASRFTNHHQQFSNRRAQNVYLDKQMLTMPSTTHGNEKMVLECLEERYEKDRMGYKPEEFQSEFVDSIPTNWTVVSMSMDVEHDVLYVNRLRANAMPLVVRLPLNRASQREADDGRIGASFGYGFEDEVSQDLASTELLSYQCALNELQAILQESHETLSLSGQMGCVDDVATMTREDKAEWWIRRENLDDRLCSLLETMEDQWLSGIKGIIQSHNTPAREENLMEFKRSLEWIMTHAVNTLISSSPSQQQGFGRRGRRRSMAKQGPILQLEIDLDLCRVIANLGEDPTVMEIKDLIYFLLDAFMFKNVAVSPSEAGMSGMESVSGDMKHAPEAASSNASSGAPCVCPTSVSSSSSLPPSPASFLSSSPYLVYSELDLGKIAEQIRDALRHYWLVETEAKNNGFDEGSHVVLILDKHLQMFPWESCPVLRDEAVSRLPSISFLRDRILQQQMKKQRSDTEDPFSEMETDEGLAHAVTPTVSRRWEDVEVDARRTFYVLNPGGDLKRTEQEFGDYVSHQPGWQGVIGRPPLDMECINGMVNNDIYIYFGHSGGEQYIRSCQIRQLGQCAVSLLLGCSSGSLKGPGEFDPTGNVMNFLLAGCPTVVANLWDVTDRDLDRLSKAVFARWGLDDNLKRPGSTRGGESGGQLRRGRGYRGRLSLVEAVKMSRDECRLKYLVGAATVVYGIPTMHVMAIEPLSYAPGFLQSVGSNAGVIGDDPIVTTAAATSATVTAAVYILIMLSGLSVIDSLIGLMVATRRSLRLTQVALAIWCLRFLFRALALVAVMAMLVVHTTEARTKTGMAAPRIPVGNDEVNNGVVVDSEGGPEIKLDGSMLVVTLLEASATISGLGALQAWLEPVDGLYNDYGNDAYSSYTRLERVY